MRAWLWLALGASLALSAWAVSRHAADEPVLATERADQGSTQHEGVERSALKDWPVSELEPALDDPFAAEPIAAQSTTPSQAPEPPPELHVVAEAPPPQPVVDYRYLGAFTTPSRQRLTVLARGPSPVVVQVGSVLDDGYIVESAGPHGVRLVQPGSGRDILIPVPSAGLDR